MASYFFLQWFYLVWFPISPSNYQDSLWPGNSHNIYLLHYPSTEIGKYRYIRTKFPVPPFHISFVVALSFWKMIGLGADWTASSRNELLMKSFILPFPSETMTWDCAETLMDTCGTLRWCIFWLNAYDMSVILILNMESAVELSCLWPVKSDLPSHCHLAALWSLIHATCHNEIQSEVTYSRGHHDEWWYI